MTNALQYLPSPLRSALKHSGSAPEGTQDDTYELGEDTLTIFVDRERWVVPLATATAASETDIHSLLSQGLGMQEVAQSPCPHCGDIAWLPTALLHSLKGMLIECGICGHTYCVNSQV